MFRSRRLKKREPERRLPPSSTPLLVHAADDPNLKEFVEAGLLELGVCLERHNDFHTYLAKNGRL